MCPSRHPSVSRSRTPAVHDPWRAPVPRFSPRSVTVGTKQSITCGFLAACFLSLGSARCSRSSNPGATTLARLCLPRTRACGGLDGCKRIRQTPLFSISQPRAGPWGETPSDAFDSTGSPIPRLWSLPLRRAILAEILTLRHQLGIYQSTCTRPCARPADRMFWV